MSEAKECTNLDDQQLMRNLITGAHGSLLERDLWVAFDHWNKCQHCQEQFPNAPGTLLQIRNGLEAEIREEITRLRHNFLSHKHRILSSSNSTDSYAAIVADLIGCADTLQYDLGFITGMGGLAGFSIFAGPDESETADAWRGCAPFIHSLDRDRQHFIFLSILSYEMLQENARHAGHSTDEENAAGHFENLLSRYALNWFVY